MSAIPRSLPRICVALGFPTIDELARAAEREHRDGNTFLELRLDYLSDPASGIDLIRRLRAQEPDFFLLATCRHTANSGGFKGSIEQQVAVLRDASAAGAQMLDLEIESAEPARKLLPDLRAKSSLVISYHNFESTPALNTAWKRLRKMQADAYKLVTTARKPTDNLRMSEFFRAKHDVPLVAFAMSDVGIPTRVLALAGGCLYTYAAPMEGSGTAPGQISARLMRGLYRAEKLSKQSRVYGVVADPVAHSKSPLIHNKAFHARRVDSVYVPFRVAAAQLGDWMKFAAGMPVAGFSVTLPHKQKIIRYLDAIEPLAKRIGAVNTVWRKAGKWRGTNTDVDGILKPLANHLRLAHANVLLAGYGGAARAAAFALKDAGAAVTITGRNLERGRVLAAAVDGRVLSIADASKQRFDVVLNSTSVGMHPNVEECLFPDEIPGRVVFDMVYNPHETELLARAKKQGCTVIHGCEMFLEQAAQQFEIWTGETAPRAVMREAFEQHI
jgi:3-dehydroquinate dehydratase/shikimate dehydrogenase